MDPKTLIDVDYNDDPWEVDESPESVIAKIEAAKQANQAMVELVEDGATGKRMWLALETIVAVYAPEDDEDARNARNREAQEP